MRLARTLLVLLAVTSSTTAAPRPKFNDPVRDPAVRPRLIKHVPPQYPDEAKKKRVQGTVVLELLVERDGRVSAGRVLMRLPFGLTQSAIDAAGQWRYTPAKDERGRLVRALVIAKVRFELPH